MAARLSIADGPAMGRSLGTSSSPADDAMLRELLTRLNGRVVLLIGDSSLRNQFMQAARVGLDFDREMPVALAVSRHKHTGAFSLSHPIRQPDRPDSSNGFWGGFPWLVASTSSNATLAYAKVWGCPDLGAVIRRVSAAMLRHRERTGLGGWPPHVTLWNFGLHLLHVYPARPVPTSSMRCALRYEQLLAQSASSLRAALPSTRLVYRTTNAVCDASFVGTWAQEALAYHCSVGVAGGSTPARCRESAARNARILALCRHRYNASSEECVRTFMDLSNTEQQRARARLALTEATLQSRVGRITLFDAFELTSGRCNATADGRHYPRLLASMNSQWIQLVTSAVSAAT